MIMKNWRTTTIGALTVVGAIITAVLEFLSSGTVTNIPVVLTAVMAGVGLLFAKDAGVTGPGL